MSTKRNRLCNFTQFEEEILIKCTLKQIKVIENKKNDACSLKEKHNAWEIITKEFNSLCPNITRHSKGLRDKYSNIKTILRKKLAGENASHQLTGGGCSKAVEESNTLSAVMAALASAISISVYSTSPTLNDNDVDDSDVDDDELLIIQPSISPPPPSLSSLLANRSIIVNAVDFDPLDFDTKNNLNIPTTSEINNWSAAEILHKPKSSTLKRPKSSASRVSTTTNNDSLQELKKKLIKRELEIREIEHKERMTLYKAKIKFQRLKNQKLKNNQIVSDSDSE